MPHPSTLPQTTPSTIALAAATLIACLLAACASDDAGGGPHSQSDPDDPFFVGKADFVASTKLWTQRRIPVCWEDARPDTATERAWVQDAVEASWDALSAVDFTGWGACRANSRGIRIVTGDGPPHTDGLGTDLDGRVSAMTLNFTFATWSPGCQATREFCIRAGAVHEFGHALGFAHEQNRLDTPGWCAGERGAFGDLSIGAWDPDSIMNYCNARWTGDGKLSDGDVAALRALYGRDSGSVAVALGTAEGFTVDAEWSLGVSAATERIWADVDGDRRADAIAVRDGGRTLTVALSTGASFGAETTWGSVTPTPRRVVLGCDVDADGRADVVIVDRMHGTFTVSRSTGSGFEPAQWWGDMPVAAANTAFLCGDVDGDGRADASSIDARTGVWSVALGTVSPRVLTVPREAIRGHGTNADGYFLADVTGDHRADAIVLYASGGTWWVAPGNDAGGFANYAKWLANHGASATARFVVDVDADGRADALVYDRRGGNWWVARSLGDAFERDRFVRGGLFAAANTVAPRVAIADASGDGRPDVLAAW